MDTTDRKIIGLLQADGRISVTELAERLPLSVSATSERLRRILASELITGFTATVDPASAGRNIEALIDVRLAQGTDMHGASFEHDAFSGVIDAVNLTGRFDMQLRVATRDVQELEDLLQALKDELGAEETTTRLILSSAAGFPRSLPLG